MEVLHMIKAFMAAAWRFFLIDVPGFRFNFAELFVALTLARMSLGYLQTMIGVTPTVTDQDVTRVSGYIAERRRRPIGFGR